MLPDIITQYKGVVKAEGQNKDGSLTRTYTFTEIVKATDAQIIIDTKTAQIVPLQTDLTSAQATLTKIQQATPVIKVI